MKLSPFGRGLIFVLVATILVGWLIFANRILPGDTFSREEAQHALNGYWLWRDMQVLDWGSFWYDTGRQLVWPFFYSWVLSIFFLVFGVGYVSARSLSLLLYLASVILVYFFANRLSEKSGWKIGMVSCLLMLTSPVMVKFASLNLLEGLGALLFLAAAFVYTVCEERKSVLEYIFLAILLGLSIYTNYLYAYLLLPAFLVVTLTKLGPITLGAIQLSRKGEKAAINFVWWAYKKLIVALVLIFLAAVWFSFHFSRKIQLLLAAIFKYSGGIELVGVWQNVVYYPKVIIENLSFCSGLGIVILISLFLPFVAARYRGLNKLYIYVWTVLFLLILTIPAKAPQMIYIIIPFIFMIFSADLIYFLDKLPEKIRKIGVVLLLIVLAIPLALRANALYFPPRPAENMIQVLDYFKSGSGISRYASVVLPLNLEHLTPEVVQFHFRDWAAPVMTDPQLTESELLDEGQFFFTVEISGKAPYQAEILDDSLYRWNSWLQEKTMKGQLRLYSSKRFEEIGVTAKIYQKTLSGQPSTHP